jgi:cation transport regulator
MLTSETLPQDVKESLPEEAQRLFIAAYNSFLENSKDEEGAARVAWQTIERNEHFTRGQDGKWHANFDEDGGGHSRPLGSAPNS